MTDHGWDVLASIAGGFFPALFVYRLICEMTGLGDGINVQVEVTLVEPEQHIEPISEDAE